MEVLYAKFEEEIEFCHLEDMCLCLCVCGVRMFTVKEMAATQIL